MLSTTSSAVPRLIPEAIIGYLPTYRNVIYKGKSCQAFVFNYTQPHLSMKLGHDLVRCRRLSSRQRRASCMRSASSCSRTFATSDSFVFGPIGTVMVIEQPPSGRGVTRKYAPPRLPFGM